MTGILERYRHLPASVYILTLAALINASGSFVRTFLTMILTDKLGFPPNEAGFIVMVALFLHLPGYLAAHPHRLLLVSSHLLLEQL